MLYGKLMAGLGIFLSILLHSPGSEAAQECRFNGGDGGNTTLANGSLSSGSDIHWKPATTSGYTEIARGTATIDIRSDCSMGNDGRSMYGAADSASSGYGSVTVDGQSAQLYPTNVTGIYYAVALQTVSGGEKVYIPPYYGSPKKLSSMEDTTMDGVNWKAILVFFQGYTNQFAGNTQSIPYLRPKGSLRLGSMGLGDPNDSNNKQMGIYVNTSSFIFTIKSATCQAMALSGGDSANTVNFGDINKSDVIDGNLPSRDFDIKLTGCNNIYRITPTITAQKTQTSGSTTLLENQLSSNAAGGIGVQLLISNKKQGSAWKDIVNKGAATTSDYTYTQSTDDGASYTANFRATLKKDGNTIKAGAFQSTATITMTYE